MRSGLLSLLSCALLSCAAWACQPAPPPDTPAARELAAVCALDGGPRAMATRLPDLRFDEALQAAARTAVSPDILAWAAGYRQRDLREHAAALRSLARAAGVSSCPLADRMDETTRAPPKIYEAADLLKVLEALGSVSPDYLGRIVVQGCAELPACARECVPGLAAVNGVLEGQAAAALAAGCAEFRAQPARDDAAITAFARKRLSAMIDQSTPLWRGDDAARAAELRKQLGL